MQVTRTLAKFLVEHKAADLPEAVRHEGARALLNWVACAVGGGLLIKLLSLAFPDRSRESSTGSN